jgi:hypothetical protein
LGTGPLEACHDAFPDQRAFELRTHTRHLEHRLSGRRRGIQSLLMGVEINAARVDLVQERDQVLQRAAEGAGQATEEIGIGADAASRSETA